MSRQGLKLVKGGKLKSDNGIDHTFIAKDKDGVTHVYVVDSKQIDGSFSVSNTLEGQQLSPSWIEAKLFKMDPNSEAYKSIKTAQQNGTLQTLVAGIDHKTGDFKVIPVKTLSKAVGE